MLTAWYDEPKEVNDVKKILKKKMKFSSSAVRYFSNESGGVLIRLIWVNENGGRACCSGRC